MSRKNSKPRSFLEEPSLEVVNAGIKQAQKEIAQLPSLLEGQEDNLYLNEATQIAEIEMKILSEALGQLEAMVTEKSNLLDAKIILIDNIENIPFSAVMNDTQKFYEEMEGMRRKIVKRDLDFLQPVVNKKEQAETLHPTQPVVNNFQKCPSRNMEYTTKTTILQETIVSTNVLNTGVVEKPRYCSDLGRKMVADVEAHQSARKMRSAFTPSNVQDTLTKSREVRILATVEEKENKITGNIFHSGGSSLDGSFYHTGATMEDILRPRSATPGRTIPTMPNFDDTGLEDFDDENKYPAPPTPVVHDAPPMNIPVKTGNLGPIKTEIVTPYKSTEEILNRRPVFTSAIGQKLGNK